MESPGAASVFLSAAEVLGVIAYKRRHALTQLAPGEPDMAHRWGITWLQIGMPPARHPILRAMRQLMARVRWWQTRHRRPQAFRKCGPKALASQNRQFIRGLLVRYRQPLNVLMRELRRDVRAQYEARRMREAAVREARKTLCAAVASQKLEALGQPGVWRARQFNSALPERVPHAYFANPHNTITEDGWATCDHEAPVSIWARHIGPDWGNLRFDATAVIALWPVKEPNRRSLSDLPAAWTLLECVAWMMLRDPDIVWDVMPEAEDAPRTFRVAHKLPDGTSRMVTETADFGLGVYGVIARWAYELNTAPDQNVWPEGSPEDALEQALRADHLHAVGTSPMGIRRPMQPDDWRGLHVRKTHRGVLAGFLVHGGAPVWTDIRVPKAEMVELWPPRKAAPAALPDAKSTDASIVSDRSGAAGRPTSAHLIKAEFQRRAEAEDVLDRISAEGRFLSAWLQNAYPGLAQLTPRSTETVIRSAFNKYRAELHKIRRTK